MSGLLTERNERIAMMHQNNWITRAARAAIIAAIVITLAATFVPPGIARAQNTPEMMVVSSSTQPTELKRGTEFDLTVVFANIGSGGASEVVIELGQGGNFVLLGQPQRINHMNIGEAQAVTLHLGISNTITTGFYSIPIQFTFHHDQGGPRMSNNGQVGVQVEGLAVSTGTGVDTGRPQIVIEDSAVLPGEDGQLDLTLTLRNTGNRWAQGIIINLGQSDYFSPAEGSSAFPVEGMLKYGETKTITVPLLLIGTPTQRITQDFTIEYSSTSGAGPFQSQQSVPITLAATAARAPRLLIESYTTEPPTVTPGAAVQLNLELTNVGAGTASEVFIRLGQDSSTLGPLAPVGSSNLQYVQQINGGASTTVSYSLVADGKAEAGLVPIDVQLEYLDEYGVKHEETQTISVQVLSTPYFQVGFFDDLPDPIVVGEPFDLPIEVINIGQTQINVSTIEVVSDDLDLSKNSAYIGPLDGGTSGTVVAQAEASETGTAHVEVRVSYLDNFQQQQTFTKVLTFEITEEASPSEEDEDTGRPTSNNSDDSQEPEDFTLTDRILRAIIGFLGLGTQPSAEITLPQQSTEGD